MSQTHPHPRHFGSALAAFLDATIPAPQPREPLGESPSPRGSDIWSQLARLDRCCTFSFARGDHPLPGDTERPWVVTLIHRSHADPPIVTSSRSLTAALTDALAAARTRGW